MRILADLMLISGAFGAAIYCMILSRRLRRLSDLDSGLGQTISLFSEQVAEMTRTLESARSSANGTTGTLEKATTRAEISARRLELLLASLHDLPDSSPAERDGPRAPTRHESARAASPTGPTLRRAAGFSSRRDGRPEQAS